MDELQKEVKIVEPIKPSEQAIVQTIATFDEMKRKFLNKCRWESAYKTLIPVRERKKSKDKQELTESDMNVMAAIGPAKKHIEEYKIQKARLLE